MNCLLLNLRTSFYSSFFSKKHKYLMIPHGFVKFDICNYECHFEYIFVSKTRVQVSFRKIV